MSVIVFTFLTFISTCDWLISNFVSRFCLGGLRSCSRTVNELLKPFSLRHVAAYEFKWDSNDVVVQLG